LQQLAEANKYEKVNYLTVNTLPKVYKNTTPVFKQDFKKHFTAHSSIPLK
jgi:hypothetical protein